MKFRVLVSFFIFASTLVAAQSELSSLSGDQWLATINAGSLNTPHSYHNYKSGGLISHGFALYFARAGNIDVPYLVYVPASYRPSKPTPVVVFLHGAILAKDSFQYKDPSIAKEPVFSIAESLNTIVVFPFARADYKWAGTSGAYRTVLDILSRVKETYNTSSIYIGGISMGGIATFWFINNKPEIFAGFYTFSAAPHSPEGAIKYSNITNSKPLFSLNAKDDPVFPYTDMEVAFKDHKGEAPGWHFSTVEAGGHRFIYGNGGDQYVKNVIGSLLGSR